ncbi:MAG: sugar kinase [Angelakisella sp.]
MADRMLLVGEPMGLFIAQEEGPLDGVSGYTFAVAGAEYNVAVGMTRLGHAVDYITKLGSDPFGKRIAHSMAQNGICTTGLVWDKEHPTGFMLKSKVRQGDPEIFYFRKNSAASTLSVAEVDAIDLQGYSNLHMTGILPALSEHCLAASRRLLERARAAGLFVSFDPNLRPALWESREKMIAALNELAARCNLVLPGIAEGELLTGSRVPTEIAKRYHQMGVDTVVVKLGAQGAYASDGKQELTVAGFPVSHVVDTVGAGDGFAVGVVSALVEGLPLSQALRRGNAIGAIQVMSIGDNEGLPTPAELENFMKRGTR